MRPPGISTFSSRMARSTWVIVRFMAWSLSASTNTRIWRSRAPVIETSPTPSTVSRTRFTCLSAISLVSRRLRGLATTTVITESESGSAFWMTGGRMFGGSSRIAPETFSRTSWAASAMSRSSTKRAVMRVEPSVVWACSSSSPESVERASSIGITTWVVTSSGVAPGRRMLMLTVAGSALGKRSTPRSRKEKTPSVTRKAMSITAKTGRRTQSSARLMAYWAASTGAPSTGSCPSRGTAIRWRSFRPSTISTSSPLRSPSLTSCSLSVRPSTVKTL